MSKRNKACLIIILIIAVGMVAFIISTVKAFKKGVSFLFEKQSIQEISISGISKNKIAKINMIGEITSESSDFAFVNEISANEIIKQLDRAQSSIDIKAVILDINSPGGGVVASDLIYRKILQLRKEKPVIALFEDTAASGAYYIASAANYIVAHPDSITGSIGVIMTLPDLQELYEKKLGIKFNVIKSGTFKDIGSNSRSLKNSEREILQGLIDEAYDHFISAIAGGRSMNKSKIKKLADGRVYSGTQAQKNGLVDALGILDDAVKKAKDLANISDYQLIEYQKPFNGLQDLLNSTIQQIIPSIKMPAFEYLWKP